MPLTPLTLLHGTGVPFYQQVVEHLRTAIREGTLQPGERLPSLRDLAAMLAVSLITVRRAYADLHQAGLIMRHQGTGTFVATDAQARLRGNEANLAEQALFDAVLQARDSGLSAEQIHAVLRVALEESHD